MTGRRLFVCSIYVLCIQSVYLWAQDRVVILRAPETMHAGKPSSITIVYEGFSDKVKAPQIPGLRSDSIISRREGREVSWINGVQKQSVSWTYEIVHARAGKVSLGPVVYVDDVRGTTIQSNTVHIEVLPADAYTPRQKNGQHSTFVAWEDIPYTVYASQIVPVRLQLYTTDDMLELQNMSPVNMSQGKLTFDPSVYTWSHTVHNGVSYRVATWEGTFSVQEAGTYALPAVDIVYATQEADRGRGSFHALFSQMIGSFLTSRTTRAPAYAIEVKPLPHTKGVQSGIGPIENLTWVPSSDTVAVGSAMSIQRTWIGDAPAQLFVMPTPKSLHGRVKIYASESVHKKLPDGRVEYTEELVVHGLEPGDDTVSAGNIMCFDPTQERYVSYALPDLPLRITGQKHTVDAAQEHAKEDSVLHNEAASEQTMCDDSASVATPLCTVESLYTLPWWMMLLLAVFPLVLLLGDRIVRAWISYVWLRIALWRWGRALVRSVAHAHTRQKRQAALTAWKEYVAHFMGYQQERSFSTYIAAWVRSYEGSHVIAEEWEMFAQSLEHMAYMDKEPSQEAWKKVVYSTKVWVKRLAQYRLQR